MKKRINLSIAGFLIQIAFDGDENTNQKRIIKGILKYHRGFMTEHLLNRPDFHIFLLRKYEKLRRLQNRIECYIKYFPQFVFLMSGIIQHLLGKGGFLLHASAVIINNKAILFFGPSGAGKSTIIRLLSNNIKPISDDGVYIKEDNGQFYVYQTPFKDENNIIEKTNKRFPLGAICYLKKDNIFEIKEIQNKQYSLIRLIEQSFTDKKYTANQVQCIFNLVKSFKKIYLLKFAENKKEILKFFSKTDVFY